MALEIACDESGYEGESLVNTTTDVFAHASVRVDFDAAAQCLGELRARIRSPALEYKATHLLREKNRSALLWFLGPDGPLPASAHVYLVDKAYAVVDHLFRLIGEPALARPVYAEGRSRLDGRVWNAFLVAANDVMRTKSPSDEVFFEIVSGLARAGGDLGTAMGRLVAAGMQFDELRTGLRADPNSLHALDPLMPALRRAVERWSADDPISIIHDRQTMLPEIRVKQLMAECGGRLASLRLVSSLTEPRIQVADFLAGIAARRIAAGVLHGRGDAELIELIRPYINRDSIWGDPATWAELRPTESGSLLAYRAVDALTEKVGVAVMTGVLLDHVDQHVAQ